MNGFLRWLGAIVVAALLAAVIDVALRRAGVGHDTASFLSGYFGGCIIFGLLNEVPFRREQTGSRIVPLIDA